MQGQYFGSNEIIEKLRKKIDEMEATISEQIAKGKEVDPSLSLALSDGKQLLASLTTNDPLVPQHDQEDDISTRK